jgi:hypothetical protein
VVLTDKYKATYANAESNLVLRGTYGTGSRAGMVCTSSRADGQRGGIGQLTINWEPGGAEADPFFLPLDDFDSQPVELYPKVERHKEFSGAGTGPIMLDTIALAYQAAHAANASLRQSSIDVINALPTTLGNPLGTDQKNYALELLRLLSLGAETYYLAGIKYQFYWHSFALPPYTTTIPAPSGHLTRGGFTQDPQGPLNGTFPTDMEWLRLADALQCIGCNGSCFKVTSTWLGGPGGHWDSKLYPNS